MMYNKGISLSEVRYIIILLLCITAAVAILIYNDIYNVSSGKIMVEHDVWGNVP